MSRLILQFQVDQSSWLGYTLRYKCHPRTVFSSDTAGLFSQPNLSLPQVSSSNSRSVRYHILYHKYPTSFCYSPPSHNMRRSFALALLSLIAVPTTLALQLGDGPISSHAARSLTTPYDGIVVREIADAVVSELSRRGLNVDNFLERRYDSE
jgi:hypothetical protein